MKRELWNTRGVGIVRAGALASKQHRDKPLSILLWHRPRLLLALKDENTIPPDALLSFVTLIAKKGRSPQEQSAADPISTSNFHSTYLAQKERDPRLSCYQTNEKDRFWAREKKPSICICFKSYNRSGESYTRKSL